MGVRIDYPMTREATVAQLAGDTVTLAFVAFNQAAHVQVMRDMCPRWRWRRRRFLEAETEKRWLIAHTIRDSLARKAV